MDNSSPMMTSTVKNLAAGILVPAILARLKLRWIAFGVAAYYGLRFLNQKGVLPQKAHQAMNVIDQGIDTGIEKAKEKIGFNKINTSSSIH